MSEPPNQRKFVVPKIAIASHDDDVDSTMVRPQPKPTAIAVTPRDRPYLIVIGGGTVGEMVPIAGEALVVGRAADAPIRFEDDGVSRRHARLFSSDQGVEIEDLGSANGTFVNGERITGRRPLADGDKITLGSITVLKFSYHDALDERFQRQMFEASFRDALTGVYNKKYLVERLDKELAYCVRHREPLSLVMADVDHFKAVNDRFGHLAGDAVLAEFAKAISETIRKEDVLARYGGEEFAVVCRTTDGVSAARLAERIRARVATGRTFHQGRVIAVTSSFGVAEVGPDIETVDGLVAAADAALYEAKASGRNRVVLRGGSVPVP